MKEFTVYQIHPDRSQIDEVNKHGWAALQNEGMEALRAKHDLGFHGSEAWEAWMFEHMEACVGVQANDLHHVFELTNLWNDEGAISRIRAGGVRSLSVGDIVLDVEADTYYMVDGYGWTEIKLPADAYEEVTA